MRKTLLAASPPSPKRGVSVAVCIVQMKVRAQGDAWRQFLETGTWETPTPYKKAVAEHIVRRGADRIVVCHGDAFVSMDGCDATVVREPDGSRLRFVARRTPPDLNLSRVLQTIHDGHRYEVLVGDDIGCVHVDGEEPFFYPKVSSVWSVSSAE